MIQKLILCAGGELYQVDPITGWSRYCLEWMNGHQVESSGRDQLITLITPGDGVSFGWLATGKRTFSTSRVLRWVYYNPNSGMTFEEALYNAEWIQGYEYRVSTQGKIISVEAKNPYAKGTPEQKWWEAGYFAALKENHKMASQLNFKAERDPHTKMFHICCRKERPCRDHAAPVVELPDAKVEILLKLNKKQAALKQQLEKVFCSYGKACWAADDSDKKEHATQIAALQNASNTLTTAILGVRDLA